MQLSCLNLLYVNITFCSLSFQKDVCTHTCHCSCRICQHASHRLRDYHSCKILLNPPHQMMQKPHHRCQHASFHHTMWSQKTAVRLRTWSLFWVADPERLRSPLGGRRCLSQLLRNAGYVLQVRSTPELRWYCWGDIVCWWKKKGTFTHSMKSVMANTSSQWEKSCRRKFFRRLLENNKSNSIYIYFENTRF